MTKAFHAWPHVGMICAQCTFMMQSTVTKKEHLVECFNRRCPLFGKIFRVPKSEAITLEEVSNVSSVKG